MTDEHGKEKTPAVLPDVLLDLNEVPITEALAGRPTRPPDFEAEAHVLSELALELTVSPGTILQRLVDLIVERGVAGSAGISILRFTNGVSVCRWDAVAGLWAAHLGGIMPCAANPCGIVVTRNTPLLFSRPQTHVAADDVEPFIHEALLIPFPARDEPVGTLWVSAHNGERAFDGEDLRLLTRLTRFASAAYVMTGALDEAQAAREDLERRVTDRTKALRESEEHHAFLLRLSDILRPLKEPAEIAEAAARQLGDHLDISRTCYGEISEGRLTIEREHSRGVSSIVGEYSLDVFDPEFLATYRAGEVVAVCDVETDARFGAAAKAELGSRSIASFADVVLLGDDQRTSILCAQHATPHSWTGAERFLIRSVGERVRSAIERARAEVALQGSEERFRAFVTASSDVIYRMSPDWSEMRRLDEPGFLADMGSPSQGWVNGTILPEDRRTIDAAIDGAIRGKRAFELEHRVRRTDGSVGWTQSRAVPILAGNGEIIEWFGAASDVTARKTAEAALRESEERYLGLYNALDQGFCTIKVAFDGEGNPTDYRFEEVSPAFEAQTGIRDAAGRWMRDITPGLDQFWFDAYGRVALTGEPTRFEAGSELLGRWWSVYAYRIGDPNARTVALLFSDITERKRTEAALRESEARLSQFGEASSDVLWMRDAATFQWMYLTPAFETIYGLDRTAALSGDNMVGWADLIVPEDRERAVANLQRVTMGERVSVEYRIRRPTNDEIRWLRDTAFPIRDASGTVRWIGGVGRDITEEKERAEHMSVLVAELQHRTRNLMGIVRATAEKTLRNSVDLADFKARYIVRLAALSRVQGLLSRLAEGGRITFDELIRSEVAAIDGEGARIVLQGPSGVALRSSTLQTFALAVHELATNAVKYGALAQPQARLEINWHLEHAEPEQEPWLHVDWRERGVVMPSQTGSQRSGSGRELIERALPYQLGARTTYVTEADGVHCTIALPVSGRMMSGKMADA
ncbi:Blue-light-activated histidine kinase [Methylobacterium bullatum]|uniref:Blue-light-activated histidine kinase n=1 Tax=Methylobacterium bullatum TaxID=570505 RepID=A0A679IV65_9HYPH|nr:Blue-light-activated histidine kinase [Methylobacterium bullatum]